jgi:hypothetical protein
VALDTDAKSIDGPRGSSPVAVVDSGSAGGTGTGRTHARQPSPVLKKLARQMMMYPLVYMLIWTIPTTIRIYQSVTGKPAPFGIATVDKACIVIQGFADAIIYGVNESSLGVWREKFSRRPVPLPEVGDQTRLHINVLHEIRMERVSKGDREAGSDGDSV